VRGTESWAIEAILALGQPAPAAYQGLKLHQDGHAAREALIDTIDTAEVSIDVCMFILARDGLGDAIVGRLCKKARAGVRVRLLLDGLGSLMERHPDLKPLLDAGAQLAIFAPPLSSSVKGRMNLRNHRKYLVVDSALAGGRLWCGGRNLASSRW
jgi:cardiolipin synthase